MTDHEKVFEVDAGGDIPEHPDLSFATTDLQGGDTGHGANAEFRFRMEGGDYEIFVEVDGEPFWLAPRFSKECVVRIVARGDWEISGLAEALVELGLKVWPLVHERQKRERYGPDDPDEEQQQDDMPKSHDDPNEIQAWAEEEFLRRMDEMEEKGIKLSPGLKSRNYAPLLMSKGMPRSKAKYFADAMHRLFKKGVLVVAEEGPPSKRMYYLKRSAAQNAEMQRGHE